MAAQRIGVLVVQFFEQRIERGDGLGEVVGAEADVAAAQRSLHLIPVRQKDTQRPRQRVVALDPPPQPVAFGALRREATIHRLPALELAQHLDDLRAQIVWRGLSAMAQHGVQVGGQIVHRDADAPLGLLLAQRGDDDRAALLTVRPPRPPRRRAETPAARRSAPRPRARYLRCAGDREPRAPPGETE